jgi:hypothetical protein
VVGDRVSGFVADDFVVGNPGLYVVEDSGVVVSYDKVGYGEHG